MRVKDDQVWSQQLLEFEADQMSQMFRDFLVQWVDTAEKIYDPPQRKSVRGCLVQAFKDTEEERGFLSVEWLGQMLLVLIQHWVHGDELWKSLSVWERRMVETAAALKIVDLQERAAELSEELDVTCDTSSLDSGLD